MTPPELIARSSAKHRLSSFVGVNAAEEKLPTNNGKIIGLTIITSAMSFLGREGAKFSGSLSNVMNGRPIPPPPEDETCESTIITGKDDYRTDADINTN